MVGTVVIIASDDQVFMRIKCCKPRKNCIPFLEAGISSTVDAERDQTAFFEKRESLRQSRNAAVAFGCHGVVSAGKITEIKGNTAHRIFFCIGRHLCVRFKQQSIVVRGICL